MRISDYTVNNDMKIDEKNKEALKQYNENFPVEQRQNYWAIFYFDKDLKLWNLVTPIIYTPLSLLFSPFCWFDEKCYMTLINFSDQEISTPYKDRD